MTEFAGNNAAVIYGGRWGTPFAFGGTNLIEQVGQDSEFRFLVTGTECKVGVYADNNTHKWTIDGGSEQTAAPSGNNVQWITLFTGLSDIQREIVFRPSTYADYDHLIDVTGAAPAIAAPTNYSNTQYRIFDASGLSEDNSTTAGGVEGYDKIRSRGSFRFKATTSIIRVWCRTDTTAKISLFIDGDPDSVQHLSIGGAWSWSSFTGLDGGAEHTYRVCVHSNSYCYSVMVPGGTMNTTALTAFAADYWFGDSTIQGSNITNADGANFPCLFGIMADRGWQINGNPGQLTFGFGQTHAVDAGNASPEPERIIQGWGINDQEPTSGVDTTEFRTAVDDITDQQVTDLPSARIVWYSILPVTSTSDRAAYNAEMADSVADRADADVIFVDMESLDPVSTGDGTHPDGTGARAIADFLFGELESAPGGLSIPIAAYHYNHHLAG